ncbi:ead/Ea22-like family protein [Citrobacter koseri]|uniref:ead/Ea22-like family protein n=1 Tax=Citrobacter koseri TaxID=545 RepID=UPI002159CAA6|nr:ead/Ea22-like family protein [Citrobacter koseri]QYG86553.1 ead/Ea22-like family protein [Citrobacter koseri]
MTDKQALRDIAEKTKIAGEAPVMPFEQRINALNDFMKHFTPATALAMLDELEAAEKRIAELERSETQLIDERDNAESALNDAYKAVMGQAPEWSNWFSFADAIDEIELACGLWRNQTEDVIQFRARIAELEARAFNPAILDVIAERQRQQSVEGWTPEHDDLHDSGELAGAAACYAHYTNARGWVFPTNPGDYQSADEPNNWPWDPAWWKPTNPRRDLVKAGALILAEIERIDRAAGIGKGE